MTVPLKILVCQHYLRETEAVLQGEKFDHVEVLAYAPVCKNPQLQPTKVMNLISKELCADGSHAILLGGCFLKNKDQFAQTCPPNTIIYKKLCFYLLAQPELVDETIRNCSYLLTPGWLVDWRNELAIWGFDQPTARDFFHECAQDLCLLDSGVDPESLNNLKEMADYLDLPYKIITIGLDHYRLLLFQIVTERKLENERKELLHSNRKIADYAMSLDLLTQLVSALTEAEIIQKIFEMLGMLFGSERMVYLKMVNGEVEKIITRNYPEPEPQVCAAWLAERQEDCAWLQEERGFYLRLSHQNVMYGYLQVFDIPLPEHRQEYINLTITIARICSLAISNVRLFEQVQYLAITDSLTGLNNRRQFMALAGHNFFQSRRYGHPLTLMMMDIDHFKKVNDTFGHGAGDQILIEIARRCEHELRDSDVLCRYGGEEFIVLLPETDLVQAVQAAERIRQSIAGKAVEVGELKVNVTISIGVASLDPTCQDLDSLIERSDQAMYRAKRRGRNQVNSRVGPDTSQLHSH